MKFLCKIVLLFFVLFLIAPTFGFYSKNDAERSLFYDFADEDNTNFCHQINPASNLIVIPLVIDIAGSELMKITTLTIVKLNSVEVQLFLPPPESL